MYLYSEVYQSSLNYFKGDDVLARIWIDKYCLKDNQKNYYELNPDDMHRRMAREFARIEQNYSNPMLEDYIYNLMKGFEYIIPQGSPMAGIGNNHILTSLSNCYVLKSPFDSYQGILHTEQQMISIMKRRGGVGFAIDSLRSKDMPTTSVSEKSSGVVLFSERYSNATREVAQDGRRGALMLSCRVTHPDILDLIKAKADLNKITGANISVMITDDFMNAVKEGKDYEVYFESSKGDFRKKVSARLVWKEIVHNAWKSAEPGVLFWDTILRESPADCYVKEGFKTISTNPCSELPLCEADSCRLIAINLFSYVKNPFTPNSEFDWGLFGEHVRAAQRLSDDLVDLEIEKIDKIIDKIENDDDPDFLKKTELELWQTIRQKAINGRRTGLGITGEGDMIAALGYRYGSDDCIRFVEMVHREMATYSYSESIILAKERGCFPIWNESKEDRNPFINRVLNYLQTDFMVDRGEECPIVWDYERYGRRNIANLTIAPTGTTSQLSQVTSGIEPLFLPVYKRRRKTTDPSKIVFTDPNGDTWEEYRVIHPKFQMWHDLNWFKLDSHLFDIDYRKDIESMTDKEIDELVKLSPYCKSTSNDVDWVAKVKMQGAIQKWVDHSISVTVNLPKEATEELVSEVYMKAWESGCKGCTVYRDGSRAGVLLSDKKEDEIVYYSAPKRPEILDCDIYHKTVLGQNWIVLVGLYKSKPYEIFAFEKISEIKWFSNDIKKGKIRRVKGGHYRLINYSDKGECLIDNIIPLLKDDEQTGTRKYSLYLRHGVKPVYIVQQIDKYATITSFDKVIARVLKNYTNGEQTGDTCPNCHAKLIFADGCEKCPNGDYSRCG